MKDSEIKKLIKTKKEGRYAAGNGLYLRISKELSVTWVVRYTISGQGGNRKRKEVTIGCYPDMSLYQASLKTLEIKEGLKAGEDPKVAKRIEKAIGKQEINNMDELAAEWIKFKKKNIKTWWRNERYYQKDIGPKIGLMRPDQVTSLHVKKLVEDVAVPGRMTVANDVLQFAKELFDYGIRLNLMQFNPARVFTCKDAGGIEEARERAIGLDELGDIFATFRKHHLQFTRENYLNCALLLTLMCRKTELSVSKIEEYNLVKKKWSLPEERIKAMKRSSKKKPINVPLEPEVIEWITELKYRAGYSPYLFPSRRSSKRFDHVGPDTLNTAIDNMFKKGFFPDTSL